MSVPAALGRSYVPTPEEQHVLQECRRNSLIRGFLAGSAGFAFARWITQRRQVAPSRFMTIAYHLGLSAAGFYAGVVSYQPQCVEKILQLSDSPMAEELRAFMARAKSSAPPPIAPTTNTINQNRPPWHSPDDRMPYGSQHSSAGDAYSIETLHDDTELISGTLRSDTQDSSKTASYLEKHTAPERPIGYGVAVNRTNQSFPQLDSEDISDRAQEQFVSASSNRWNSNRHDENRHQHWESMSRRDDIKKTGRKLFDDEEDDVRFQDENDQPRSYEDLRNMHRQRTYGTTIPPSQSRPY